MPHALPTIEIRFPVRYAWGVIVGGAIFFFLGLLLGGKNPGLGAFISFVALGAVIGANYAECNKRWNAARETKLSGESSVSS